MFVFRSILWSHAYILRDNILVDARGHPHVAGLGVALLSAVPRAGSDGCAFGVLAWEVSPLLEHLMDKPLNGMGLRLRFLLDELRSPMRVGSKGFTRC